MKLLSSLAFGNYVILWGHILNICKTVFSKLTFNQWGNNQVTGLLFRVFYIHSTNLINHRVQNNFNVFFIKNNESSLLRHTCFGEFNFVKLRFQKKLNFVYLWNSMCFFLSGEEAFPTFDSNLRRIRYFDILLRFFCKNKLFILFMAILYKNICKNVMWRGHIFVFLQVI